MGKGGKRHRTRSQHYVPQQYLRGFTDASGKLHCYDKASDKVFGTSPANVAQESNFYEIAPGTTVTPVPDNVIEKELARIESEMAPVLRNMIASADRGKIDPDLISEFMPYIAVQWLRTRTVRDTLRELANKSTQALADDLVRVNFGEEPKVVVQLREECIPALHAEHMLNPEMIVNIALSLERLICVVGITTANTPLYTSDHPVVRRANRSLGGRPMVGPRDPGIEYAYPLDRTHLLLMLEKQHFKEWRRHDARSVPLIPEQVRDYNGLQVRRSSRLVYCPVPEFALARELCQADPAIRDPDRPRAVVETTPMEGDGETMRNYMFVNALE